VITAAPAAVTAYDDADPAAFETSRWPRLSKSNPNGVPPADGDTTGAEGRPSAPTAYVSIVLDVFGHDECGTVRCERDLCRTGAARAERLRRAGERRQAVVREREPADVARPAGVEDVRELAPHRHADRMDTAGRHGRLEVEAAGTDGEAPRVTLATTTAPRDDG